MTKEEKKPGSFQNKLFIFIILSWVVPITILIFFMTISYKNIITDKMKEVLETEIQNSLSFITERVNDQIMISQNWKLSSKDLATSETESPKRYNWRIYNYVNNYIQVNFASDLRFNTSLFYPIDENISSVYISRMGESFKDFTKEFDEGFLEYRERDSSDVSVIVIKSRIFIIRNLYTYDNYKKFGMLVLEVNQDKLFAGIQGNSCNDIVLCIGDKEEILAVNRTENSKEARRIDSLLLEEYKPYQGFVLKEIQSVSYQGMYMQQKERDYDIGMVLGKEKTVLFFDFSRLYCLLSIIVLILIPIFIYVIYFFDQQISGPINRLVTVSKIIKEGKIGTVVEGESMPNAEFDYLMISFNRMSRQIKELFDYAYDENLARKDAKILALQAQINPHFLNNTLEMMNWQARISGDITVSKMIEALSTVLDYRLDRANTRLIHLTEELRCADAYIYIISMRFGQRLKIEKHIDETILQTEVPRLILQPILENAVVHGVEHVQSGIIKLHIYHDNEKIYLRVVNTGKPMGEEEKERINAILSGDAEKESKEKGYHISLGIRNVNERIKLIYGEGYGLTIQANEESEIESTIVIPYKQD
jgi:two-component system sensor histidine kinase YesM